MNEVPVRPKGDIVVETALALGERTPTLHLVLWCQEEFAATHFTALVLLGHADGRAPDLGTACGKFKFAPGFVMLSTLR